LLADIVWQLDARPEEWERVRADPQRADRIVEEAVRLASPSAAVFRRVVHDTTLGGYPLPAGATLVVSVLSANRDETVFPDSDRFDPDRPTTQRHVAFGQGIHACIGNVLARMGPPRRAGPRSHIEAQRVRNQRHVPPALQYRFR
jgi:cytochrome P450